MAMSVEHPPAAAPVIDDSLLQETSSIPPPVVSARATRIAKFHEAIHPGSDHNDFVSLYAVRELAFQGIPEDVKGLRPVYWKVLLFFHNLFTTVRYC